MSTAVLIPAYGRDYKTDKEAKAAWADGADFEFASAGPDMGRYCSIRDLAKLREAGFRWANIRYHSMSRVSVIKLGA